VHSITVTTGSLLHLNNLKVYCDGPVDNQGTIIGGEVIAVP
jgi:hypothetical protein